SDYTYKFILGSLESATTNSPADRIFAQNVAGEGLLVSGIINLTNNEVELAPFVRFSTMNLSLHPVTSTFSIDLINSSGLLLTRYPFEPQGINDTLSGSSRAALIAKVVPYLPSTHRIVISKGGQELASRTVSVNAPQVKVIFPNGGETLEGNTATVT